jgi:hypothetical protein
MNDENDVTNISLVQANAAIEKSRALDRLTRNKDFLTVIHEGYFKDEAVRLVHAKASAMNQEPEFQAGVLRDIDGIGSLMSYFQVIDHEARMSTKALQDHEEDREFDESAE